MSRDQYQWFEQSDFRGGICEEPENAKPNQVLDARNVWCPEGRIQVRPGVVGETTYLTFCPSAYAGLNPKYYKETITGGVSTFTEISRGFGGHVNSLQIGERVYIGTDYPVDIYYLNYPGCTYNVNKSWFIAEYYDGTDWVYLPSNIYSALVNYPEVGFYTYAPKQPYLFSSPELGGDSTILSLVKPGDWASCTVGSYLKYYIRLTVTSSNLDSSVNHCFYVGSTYRDSSMGASYMTSMCFSCCLQFPNEYRYVFVETFRNVVTYYDWYMYMRVQQDLNGLNANYYKHTENIYDTFQNPPSYAIIPQFNKAYVSISSVIYCIPFSLSSSTFYNTTTNLEATIESRPEFIGTISGIKQLYHPDYVSWLNDFPNGKYVEFFNGQLWVANLIDEPYTVRWSAPQPAFELWPSESYEVLMEDDNSPITGIKAFGENLAVFKQDSIWRMIYNGTSGTTGLNTYVPKKIPGGIGCVSNSSIVDINGILVFMSEDGIYSFDGANKPIKISQPINETFNKITPGAKQRSVSCCWKNKNCYLLAVNIGGDYNISTGTPENNTVLVYDYKNGSWWIWDNMNVVSWLISEDENDVQVVRYNDSLGRIYLLSDKSKSDHGTAISSYIRTQRIGYGSANEKLIREVRMSGENQDNSTITVSVQREDEEETGETSGILSFADSTEHTLGSFVLGTDTLSAVRRRERRLKFRRTGKWFTVKVSHSTNHKTFSLDKLSAGFIPQGIR